MLAFWMVARVVARVLWLVDVVFQVVDKVFYVVAVVLWVVSMVPRVHGCYAVLCCSRWLPWSRWRLHLIIGRTDNSYNR